MSVLLEGGFYKYVVEMDSGDMIYVPSSMTFSSGLSNITVIIATI
jgi:hypothetical protein